MVGLPRSRSVVGDPLAWRPRLRALRTEEIFGVAVRSSNVRLSWMGLAACSTGAPSWENVGTRKQARASICEEDEAI